MDTQASARGSASACTPPTPSASVGGVVPGVQAPAEGPVASWQAPSTSAALMVSRFTGTPPVSHPHVEPHLHGAGPPQRCSAEEGAFERVLEIGRAHV